MNKKKYFLYLQLRLQNFCSGSIIAFLQMKRGSAPATPSQTEFSSGQVCHFHSHLACLSFAPPPALRRSKPLPALPKEPCYLLSAAYQQFLLRNYLPSKGKSLLLPYCWGQQGTTAQGLWAGEVGWPLTAPEGNMASNLGWAINGLCVADQSFIPSLSPSQDRIRVLGVCASYHKCGVLGNW